MFFEIVDGRVKQGLGHNSYLGIVDPEGNETLISFTKDDVKKLRDFFDEALKELGE